MKANFVIVLSAFGYPFKQGMYHGRIQAYEGKVIDKPGPLKKVRLTRTCEVLGALNYFASYVVRVALSWAQCQRAKAGC